MSEAAAGKVLLRKEMRQRCTSADPAYSAEANRKINRLIMGESLRHDCRKVGVFYSDGSEPDLGEFIEYALSAGIRVYLPRYRGDVDGYEMAEIRDLAADVECGRYGIHEPKKHLPTATSEEMAGELMWLVPGVAFDAAGNRLGRGRGYFDRLLASVTGVVVGVFFSFQRVDSIPAEKHDRRLDCAVTDEGIEWFSKKEKM